MHYQKYFETNKLNLRKTWEGIREVINIRKKKGQTKNTLNTDDGIINKDRKRSEQFSKTSVILLKQLKMKYYL